jgi:hypothetical protein
MGMRYRILAALSALVVAGRRRRRGDQPASGCPTGVQPCGTQTNFAVIPAGGAATINPSNSYVPNTGDDVTFRDTLTQGTATVGFDTVICTDTFNNNGLCTDVISITNVGDIHLTALVRGLFIPFSSSSGGPSTFDASIDGGTFAYANATGYMHGVDVNSNVTDYTLFLN